LNFNARRLLMVLATLSVNMNLKKKLTSEFKLGLIN
jgi:hypothetical protein